MTVSVPAASGESLASVTVDCLFSADLMVDDTIQTAGVLIERLGLPALRRSWTDDDIERLLYLRAFHPFNLRSPTLIELVRANPAWPSREQSECRPVRTHATVFVTKSYPELIAHLQAGRVRHFDMPDRGDGLQRCWIGVDNFDVGSPGNAYDPDADGNLYVEVISWQGTALAQRAPLEISIPEGSITRVMARSFLVPDLDYTLDRLHNALGWSEAVRPAVADRTARHSLLQPEMASSAALELIQPTSVESRYRDFYKQWGLGPHAIRLGVHGLDAKAADLRRRDTPFTEGSTLEGDGLLLVDAPSLGGTVVELADDPLV